MLEKSFTFENKFMAHFYYPLLLKFQSVFIFWVSNKSLDKIFHTKRRTKKLTRILFQDRIKTFISSHIFENIFVVNVTECKF